MDLVGLSPFQIPVSASALSVCLSICLVLAYVYYVYYVGLTVACR